MHDRQSLIEALAQTRGKMEALVGSLSEEQLDVPYHPGVNPPVWETGHATFFYEVFVLDRLDGTAHYDPAMDELWDSFHMDHEDRWSRILFPSRSDTLAYMDTILQRVRERIETQPLTDEALYLYRYAIYHQNMHVESMTWCRQTVGYPAPPFSDPEGFAQQELDTTVLGDAVIPAGRYRIGMPSGTPAYASEDFAFDNEKPAFDVEMPSFAISRTLVSNAEFVSFVEAGGYERQEFWSQGGRKWLQREVDLNFGSGEPARLGQQKHPFHWRHREGAWQERVFDRWLPLLPAHPVKQISYWEAEAYCRWAGRRLPTEYEWEVAALGNRPGEPRRLFPWGSEMDPDRVDMDARYMGRLPVTALAEGESPFGCRQMVGTVWEWTSNQFLPYDGFAVDVYPYMSTLQFGDHKTTKGGGCAASSLLVRGTYRQAYHPDRADVFTGFRTCALDGQA
jgi:iron(II)-dependent oxidoreductase